MLAARSETRPARLLAAQPRLTSTKLHIDHRQTVHGIDRVRRQNGAVPLRRQRAHGLLLELTRVEAHNTTQRHPPAISVGAVLGGTVPRLANLKRPTGRSRVPNVRDYRILPVGPPRTEWGIRVVEVQLIAS